MNENEMKKEVNGEKKEMVNNFLKAVVKVMLSI